MVGFKIKLVSAVAAASLMLFVTAAYSQAEIAGGATKKTADIKATINVSKSMLNDAVKDSKAWLHSNGDYTNSRY